MSVESIKVKEAELLQEGVYIITSPGCMNCKLVTQFLDSHIHTTNIYTINSVECPKLISDLNITAVPTVIVKNKKSIKVMLTRVPGLRMIEEVSEAVGGR